MSLKSEALRYWSMGQYDTAHIAEILNVPEAEVYGAISSRFGTEQSAATKQDDHAAVRKRAFRFAGYDPSERQFR